MNIYAVNKANPYIQAKSNVFAFNFDRIVACENMNGNFSLLYHSLRPTKLESELNWESPVSSTSFPYLFVLLEIAICAHHLMRMNMNEINKSRPQQLRIQHMKMKKNSCICCNFISFLDSVPFTALLRRSFLSLAFIDIYT